MNTVIYMIRHAESPFILGEEKSRKLSTKGEEDAKRVANILSNKDIDIVVYSSYTRAIQTVQEVALSRNLEVKEYEELIERPIKGLEHKLSKQEIIDAVRLSFEDKEYCLEDGESTFQAQNRAIPVIKQLLNDYQGKNIVIGTHGNIMTIILNYFNSQYGYDFWESTSKPDIYKLDFNNENQLLYVDRLWD